MGRILVTGGCGFIGSHTIVELINHGFEVVCIDNLSNSDNAVLDGIYAITGFRVKNYENSVTDRADLENIFHKENITGVIHFAALKSVNESVHQPLLYYQNNIIGLITLLEVMEKFNCHHFIFSSSCSVYGNSLEIPVTEKTPLAEPESPYARTKLIGEQILRDIANSNSLLKSIALRYFNPAGSHPSILIGESPTNNATNLVPVVTKTAIGIASGMTVFGNDYPTRDGTCIRDYIHVSDIAAAHVLALKYLLDQKNQDKFEIFNLGTGVGNTVLEVIHSFEKLTGIKLNYQIGERRMGDVIEIYANNDKAKERLNWKINYNIDDIMQTAWEWELKRNK